MSAILYNLTVTDRNGKVIHEVVHTSPVMLVTELPAIKEKAEKFIRSQEEKQEKTYENN